MIQFWASKGGQVPSARWVVPPMPPHAFVDSKPIIIPLLKLSVIWL